MALESLLQLANDNKKVGLSEERVRALIPVARDYTAFWRSYPDLFVDFMSQKTTFKLYYYQRCFLRGVARHKYFYGVFPRAYSKSFLAILTLMIRCVLYPGAKLFVTSGGKEQSAGIIKDKVQEICQLMPAFEREIDFRRGKTIMGKDYVKVVFKNGSYFDNIAANEKSRGKRRHGFVGEECVGIDGKILSEVLIPITNISRLLPDGTSHKEEKLNKSQCMITTAGYKNTFAYNKLIQYLIWEIVNPEISIIMGGTWRLPVVMGLHDRDFIKQLKQDGTFNESSFEREYESIWSGTSEDAYFRTEIFDRNRKLAQPEKEYSGRSAKNAYYVISVDVGRKGCDTVVCIFKVTPQPQGAALKSLVNIFTLTDEHFEDQAIAIKRTYYNYKAKQIVLDANGLGIGLLDYMVKSQTDHTTGEVFPDFGVSNDPDGYYKKYRTAYTEFDAIYALKATPAINTEAHTNVQTQLTSGKVKLLIDERIAKNKLLGTRVGQNMSTDERAKYLKPFTLTSILKEEMANLREENEGVNIILKRVNKSIPKDKFSAFEYGLYWIKQEEDSYKKKKRFNVKDFLLMN